MSETITDKPVPVVDVRTLADAYRMRAELKDAEDVAAVHRKELEARKIEIAENAYDHHAEELNAMEANVVLADQEAGRIENEIAAIISQYAEGGILEEGDYCLKDVASKPKDTIDVDRFMKDFPNDFKSFIVFGVTDTKNFLKRQKKELAPYLLPKTWVPQYQVEKKVPK
jgi:hypothetical protein